MCMNCFRQYTAEPVVNERVQAAYDLIEATHGEADYSILLHIIVADMNVDDHWFGTEYTAETYPGVDQWERDIFDALKALTEEERATAVAMSWGYFDRNGTPRA